MCTFVIFPFLTFLRICLCFQTFVFFLHKKQYGTYRTFKQRADEFPEELLSVYYHGETPMESEVKLVSSLRMVYYHGETPMESEVKLVRSLRTVYYHGETPMESEVKLVSSLRVVVSN